MNYRHSFHAGNFADVFKHFILCLFLEKLREKDKGFFVLDTHAGIGKYDLIEKNQEYLNGIAKIYGRKIDSNFASYQEMVRRFNFFKELKIYPGSPKIIKNFLRPLDQAIFCELHQEDFVLLKRAFAGDKSVQIFKENGYQFLKSHLPPIEGRGLVLIDPPFEKENGREDDFLEIIKYLQEGIKRFAHGMYLIWYPIVDEKKVEKFYQSLDELKAKLKVADLLKIEFGIDASVNLEKPGFRKCGMIAINPPWQFEEKINKSLPLLLQALGQKNGEFRIR